MKKHPKEYVSIVEAFAYMGFSDDEIDKYRDKFEDFGEAYKNSEFRSLCLKNHYYLSSPYTLTKTVIDGYIDITLISMGSCYICYDADNYWDEDEEDEYFDEDYEEDDDLFDSEVEYELFDNDWN